MAWAEDGDRDGDRRQRQGRRQGQHSSPPWSDKRLQIGIYRRFFSGFLDIRRLIQCILLDS